jgi:hypothetical protein
MKLYDIICWKGNGILFRVLSFLLGLFDSRWRKRAFKPWHMAIVCGRYADGDWKIFEATSPRCRVLPLSVLDNLYKRPYKIYHWFDNPPSIYDVEQFVNDRVGAKYDALVYVFTVIQKIFDRLFGMDLPRLLDSSYTCWELVEEFCNCMGKPWYSTHTHEHKYPLISDFLKEADKNEVDNLR